MIQGWTVKEKSLDGEYILSELTMQDEEKARTLFWNCVAHAKEHGGWYQLLHNGRVMYNLRNTCASE